MSSPAHRHRALLPAAGVAVLAPTLLAFNPPPSPTFLNQALAFSGWGLLACVLGWVGSLDMDRQRRALQATWLPATALLIIGAAAALSWFWGSLPSPLALSGLATLLATYVLLAAGSWAGAMSNAAARHVFIVFCLAWMVGGLAQALIAAVQVFAPQWADGTWIAKSALPGRAVGNLRQPNHVCTILLWSVIATIALHDLRALAYRLACPALVLMAVALVLTASRSALVGVILMAVWGAADRRLAGRSRVLLLAMPLLYALAWFLIAAWTSAHQEAFGAQDRLHEADLSASRFGIWSDTLQLIRQYPLLGVGFGEFNFAWSLSEMPHRPPAFFDHTHNLVLQWAVEYGVPAAVALTAILVTCLVRMARTAHRTTEGERSRLLRITLAFLLLMALHSQLEYPLWYAYFLLPTAFLLGFGHAQATVDDSPVTPRTAGDVSAPTLLVGGVALMIGSAAAVVDYTRVSTIFDSQSPLPLSERISRGQRSFFFAHHADYAAATTSEQPRQELSALNTAAHYLLDTRLMIAWAQAWAAAGDLPRARYLAARLREFHNPNSAEFFAPCELSSEVPAASTQPFQCETQPAGAALRWIDFR